MKRHFPVSLLLVGACSALPVAHAADDLTLPATQIESSSDTDDDMSVGYEGKASSSTTKLGLTDKQTPQAVTTITRQALDDFKINGVKDALRSAPSVTVEQTETDRTEFTSRGFDINTFEYDGMGMPFVGTVLVGEQDLAEYEQIDVLHGANGLMSGAGNPSATVNFVRKRPTKDFQAQIQTSVGSWDNRRIDVDVAGPLTDTGNVRGRFIYSHDKGNSWMDRYSHERNVAAGLLAFDVSDADTVTVGFSQHNSDSNGSTWGNLPLVDAAGNAIHYSSRSSSIGQPWTYWNLHTTRTFIELKHDFGNDWNATVTATGVQEKQNTNMLYVGAVSGDDASAYANHTSSEAHQLLGEAKVQGPFSLFGREHQLTFGAAYGRTHQKGQEYDENEEDHSSFETPFGGILTGNTPKPPFGYTSDDLSQNFQDTQKSMFAGARFSLTDDLHWIAGARMLSADGKGDNYGADYSTRAHGKVTPYTGLVYDITDTWSVYGSWTKIYSPQYNVGEDHSVLDPLEGKSMEVGVKGGMMDERLHLTAALFKTEQRNVAVDAGFDGEQEVYTPENFKSHGIELQASGEAFDGLDVLAGYTYVRIDNDDGEKARKYVPTHSFRGMATYRLPGIPQMKVGARVSWQTAVENDDNSAIKQNAYGLVDLMSSYDIDSNWSTSLNLNNVTDRKYLLSLYNNAQTASYGAPRNLTASVTWKY
ncbi:TonB-dependent siderophore receptor [Pseudomonas sp. NFR16]|uniref:TonB-dependent siderophore receptor n=1 Tax=Pseudomonas sp. NFR16 TaxID=1566248 RepID=UPI0008CDEEBD|nr:TonB-dependent siderophore receptor [Pseudomonas sp. NFR16]SEJ96413.1 outer-membrane receptor for ferric coprogen and ferric-rhodotorulic acid [Pseudomonas sp. NFR16]